jgi:hypothetical protein
MSWMHRLRRVYDIDVSVCPNCGGALKVLAVITELNLLGRFPRFASPSQAGRGAMLQPSVAATCWRSAFIASRLA